jgi:hypothetical protein
VPGFALSRAAWIDFIGEFSEPLLPLLPELETQITRFAAILENGVI